MNGDGHKDLLTGCFEGGLYLVEGLGGGQFAKAKKVLDQEGNILRLGQYWDDEEREWTGVEGSEHKEFLGISGHAVDFDDDGDFDLLIGSNEGYIFVRENVGTPTAPDFATVSTQLVSAGDEGEDDKPLYTGDSHAMPVVYDWDGDGMFDIVTGRNDGGVMWARNIGTKGNPEFTQLDVLIESGREDAEGIPVGSRSQVAVGDFDMDGHSDVLVGDYNTVALAEKQAEDDEVDVAEIRKSLEQAATVRGELETKIKALRELESESELAEGKLEEIEEKLRQHVAKMDELLQLYYKHGPKTERHGFVWLFKGVPSGK